jgi:hypothetical protein
VPPKEGDGLIAWDEGQDQLWNRDYNDAELKARNRRLLKELTRLRKYGWACLFASQNKSNTDKQARNIATWEIKLRNQREMVRIIGIRVLPMPLFVAAYCEAADGDRFVRPVYQRRYVLRWHRKLYNTMDLTFVRTDRDAEAPDLVKLPRLGRRVARAADAAEASAALGAEAATDSGEALEPVRDAL